MPASTSSTTARSAKAASSATSIRGSTDSNPTPIASAAIPGRARASSSRSRTITARAPTPVLAALPRSGFARCRSGASARISYKGHKQLRGGHPLPQGRDGRYRRGRGVHAGDLAVQHRGLEHATSYYKTDEEYLFAIADAMREEYKAIVDAGFLLQIDDPLLVDLLHRCIRSSTRRGVPQMGAAAGRGAQPRAARHPRGSGPLPHLLQHQHGPARPRHGAEGHRRHHAEDQRRRLLVRGRQPAPRARMAGLGRT